MEKEKIPKRLQKTEKIAVAGCIRRLLLKALITKPSATYDLPTDLLTSYHQFTLK